MTVVGAPVGGVDGAEFRTICQRLVKAADLELANLIVREAAALLERRSSPGPAAGGDR